MFEDCRKRPVAKEEVTKTAFAKQVEGGVLQTVSRTLMEQVI